MYIKDLEAHRKEIDSKLISIMELLIQRQMREYCDFLVSNESVSMDVKIHKSVSQIWDKWIVALKGHKHIDFSVSCMKD